MLKKLTGKKLNREALDTIHGGAIPSAGLECDTCDNYCGTRDGSDDSMNSIRAEFDNEW
jgi:hypothetical protein